MNFDQEIIRWVLMYLGLLGLLFIGLQFRKPKIIKQIVYKEIEVPKIIKVEVPMLPKRVVVTRNL